MQRSADQRTHVELASHDEAADVGLHKVGGASGRRPCLVLLPGTLCDARLFQEARRALRRNARMICVGLDELQRPSKVPDWAARLLKRLPPRFVLGGFSLGGLLALELLRQAPQRIQGLVMIASNAEAVSRAGARRSQRLWCDWRSLGAAQVARGLKPRYFHYERQRHRHARLVRNMALATPSRAAHAQFEWAAKRPEGLGQLARSGAPLLVISGERDHLCPAQLQRRMVQAHPLTTWIELPRCGHFVPLEAASAMNRALQRWLRVQCFS